MSEFLKFVDSHNGAITAVATILIAAFTIVLAFVTRRQAILTRAGIELARDEFIATHRPKLRVRSIRRHPSPLVVHYLVVNVGETRASIKQHHITLLVDPTGDLKEATQTPVQMECRDLESGESFIFASRSLDETSDAEFDYAWSEALNNGSVKVRGYIEYQDRQGRIRRTGFLRIYNAKVGRFLASDDPEEEYED